jgi:hypothetical protein
MIERGKAAAMSLNQQYRKLKKMSKREAKNDLASIASAALAVVAVGGFVSAAVNKSETTALVSTAPLVAAGVVQGQKED